jgi:hypothetical protein
MAADFRALFLKLFDRPIGRNASGSDPNLDISVLRLYNNFNPIILRIQDHTFIIAIPGSSRSIKYFKTILS